MSDDKPTSAEYKALHVCIKKVSEAIERFSFNTCVSQFMISLAELQNLKCRKKAILEPFIVLLAPFAPHIAEEIWHDLGHDTTVCDAKWPELDEAHLVEDSVKYPVAFNGKTRFTMEFPVGADPKAIENAVVASEQAAKYIDGKPVRKVIVVPGKMINVVI